MKKALRPDPTLWAETPRTQMFYDVIQGQWGRGAGLSFHFYLREFQIIFWKQTAQTAMGKNMILIALLTCPDINKITVFLNLKLTRTPEDHLISILPWRQSLLIQLLALTKGCIIHPIAGCRCEGGEGRRGVADEVVTAEGGRVMLFSMGCWEPGASASSQALSVVCSVKHCGETTTAT